MDVVLQRVQTSWTKRSRGGAEATRRNAAPVAFLLPSAAVPFVHEVVMSEEDDFVPRATVRDGVPGRSDSVVVVREGDGMLRVETVVTSFGLPRRWRRPPAVRLAVGQWLRWQVNYRFGGGSGEWWYRLDTLNILYGRGPTDVFLSEPGRYVSELASLR